jgi:hypothetical protein
MKRIALFLLLFLSLCRISQAQSIEVRRRIEEEKRQDLAPSEFYRAKIEETSLPDAGSGQEAYFTELLAKETADLSDACRTIVLLMGMNDQFSDRQARFNFLKEEGIIPKNIDADSDHSMSLRKGVIAYMLAKTIDIKGGITLRIFGVNQRYAFKELVYEQIMYPGNVSDIISGQELILTLTQAADYLASREEKP